MSKHLNFNWSDNVRFILKTIEQENKKRNKFDYKIIFNKTNQKYTKEKISKSYTKKIVRIVFMKSKIKKIQRTFQDDSSCQKFYILDLNTLQLTTLSKHTIANRSEIDKQIFVTTDQRSPAAFHSRKRVRFSRYCSRAPAPVLVCTLAPAAPQLRSGLGVVGFLPLANLAPSPELQAPTVE